MINMNYIEAFSGRKIYYQNPTRDSIWIGDIALGLSNICRYTGQVPKFYSVAEHCVLGLNFLKDSIPEIQKNWLMHDATEAYMSDVPSPLKALIPGYKSFEEFLARVIFSKYDVNNSPETKAIVKSQDYSMLKTEAKLMGKNINEWTWLEKYPLIEGLELQYWPPEEAEQQFMNAFEELFGHGFID